mmetsp:Transcript_10427/g.14587  ORF Transcript_10427/g.14587 Transcript_10427/m.14587 type:complete len:211 (+) Transcript_10427:1303-1935(+)
MAEGKVVSFVLRLVVNLHHNIIDEESLSSICANGVNLLYLTKDVGGTKNLMGINNLILVNNTDYITSSNNRPLAKVSGSKSPALLTCQTRNIHTLGYVHVTSPTEDVLQRTLDTIKNGSHNTRTKLYRKRLLFTKNGITDSKTGGILVHLDGGGVTLELNNFSYKLGVSDTDKLVHCCSRHTISNNEGTGHLEDESVVILFLDISHVFVC